ncbi:PP2C family serine/threonine-protein phosphatase [Streptomyces sp. NPDC058475]|uniref:PP2C family serine/threonine-protein phosphatase n=1 Tax=Streptomyces sp. NPDC058475 TaxID=3346518 RepID=UPI0036606028
MSQQGEKPTGHEDDWWGQLYDDSTEDTGPAAAADSLDDRFASAAGTVGLGPAAAEPGAAAGRGPAARRPGAPPRDVPPRPGRPPGVPGSSPAEPEQPPVVPEQRGGAFDSVPAPVSGSWPGATPRSGLWERGDFAEARVDADSFGRGDSSGAGAGSGPVERGGFSGARADADSFGRGDSSGVGAGSGPSGRGDVSGAGAGSGSGSGSGSFQRGGLAGQPAPWEPPPVEPPPPASFPPGPTPPGFRSQEPGGGMRQEPLSGTSAESPGAAVPASRAPVDVPPASPPARAAVPPPPASPPAVPPGDTVPFAPSDGPPPQPAFAPRDTPPRAPEPEPESGLSVPRQPPVVDHVGSGPPTYDAEPTALPPADPDDLDDLVADTVLDGARYGTSTLRAVSVRGDSARYRGEPRRDSLLTARFGAGEQALVLVAMATGARATPGAHRAAAEACQWIGRAVGRSHARLAEDIRAARRGDLKSGLHRLTDRSLGKLRASAAEQGVEPEEYTASLRCLLLPADPQCRTRVFFGVGAGGLFRLRDGEWQDIEPRVAEATGEAVVGFGSLPHETPEGDRLTMDLGITTPPSPYEPAPEPPRDPFRFRASVARPGDTLLLCTGGLAEPLRGEPELVEHLTTRWSTGEPPGLAAFLADTVVRVKGYADDRTAAAVWEA